MFWPARKRADVTIGVRIGRALHWLLVAVAAIIAAAAVYVFIVDHSDYRLFDTAWMFWPAIAVFMLGRGCRYIFSGE
jgi:TRAP-type mannitol/chloroaromatic compound transport system permease small subunit